MPERTRACYLGPVQRHRLEAAVAPINEAFDSMCYLVGSCLTRPDYRDVDVRLILDDGDFMRLFGFDLDQAHGRATALWTSLAVTYSRDLSALTGLEVDFQIQAVTSANARELGERHALFVTKAKLPEWERELGPEDEAVIERVWQQRSVMLAQSAASGGDGLTPGGASS